MEWVKWSNITAFYEKPAFCEEPYGERQEDVLLLEDPGGEGILRVILVDRDRLLQNDGPPVHGGVDEVNRAARDFDARGDGIAVGVCPRERGEQRRMDIDDPVRERADERRGNEAHEAREDDQLDAFVPEDF